MSTIQSIAVVISSNTESSAQGVLRVEHWTEKERARFARRRILKIVGAVLLVAPVATVIHLLIIPTLLALFLCAVGSIPFYWQVKAVSITVQAVEGQCPYCRYEGRLTPYVSNRWKKEFTVQCPKCGQTSHAVSQVQPDPDLGVLRKVQVWIMTRSAAGMDQVLLLRTTPDRGAFWQPVTGSVIAGESRDAGARRELAEETGFKGAPRWIGYAFEYEGRWGKTEESVYCFILDSKSVNELSEKSLIKLHRHEHDQFEWVKPDQVVAKLKFESNQLAFHKLQAWFEATSDKA